MLNQRALAASLGISQSTVARALRGSTLVNPETRRRIETAASQIGYRPNPLVSTLMAHIRSGRNIRDQGVIAILVDAPSVTVQAISPVYHAQHVGLQRRALSLGYTTEVFPVRNRENTDAVLDKMLYSRGIAGVILAAPLSVALTSLLENKLQLKWERYAFASISYDWQSPLVDRATANHRRNVDIAYHELLARGYTRIGLSLPRSAFNSNDSNWLSGYMVNQYYHPPETRIPLFVSPPTLPGEAFRDWYQTWKPDALLCLTGEELEWMQAIGLSPLRDMALVCLNRPAGSHFSGVDEDNVFVGETACDIVVDHITRNTRGVPERPRLILVDGKWTEGETLPSRKPISTPKKRSPANWGPEKSLKENSTASNLPPGA
jgi:LacI family transcriptional regulator